MLKQHFIQNPILLFALLRMILKDPVVIEQVVKSFLDNKSRYDYVSNVHPTFSEGQDTEVFSSEVLYKAASQTTDPYNREHVTAYFYQNPRV